MSRIMTNHEYHLRYFDRRTVTEIPTLPASDVAKDLLRGVIFEAYRRFLVSSEKAGVFSQQHKKLRQVAKNPTNQSVTRALIDCYFAGIEQTSIMLPDSTIYEQELSLNRILTSIDARASQKWSECPDSAINLAYQEANYFLETAKKSPPYLLSTKLLEDTVYAKNLLNLIEPIYTNRKIHRDAFR